MYSDWTEVIIIGKDNRWYVHFALRNIFDAMLLDCPLYCVVSEFYLLYNFGPWSWNRNHATYVRDGLLTVYQSWKHSTEDNIGKFDRFSISHYPVRLGEPTHLVPDNPAPLAIPLALPCEYRYRISFITFRCHYPAFSSYCVATLGTICDVGTNFKFN